MIDANLRETDVDLWENDADHRENDYDHRGTDVDRRENDADNWENWFDNWVNGAKYQKRGGYQREKDDDQLWLGDCQELVYALQKDNFDCH